MKFALIALLLTAATAQAAETYNCTLNYSKLRGSKFENDKVTFGFSTELVNPNGRNEKTLNVTLPKSKIEASIVVLDMEHSCVDPQDCKDIPASWKDWFTLSVRMEKKEKLGSFTTTFMRNQLAIYGGWNASSQTAVINCDKL